jgi:hypothetical protein
MAVMNLKLMSLYNTGRKMPAAIQKYGIQASQYLSRLREPVDGNPP